MATITATSLQAAGAVATTQTTLDGSSDTFTYDASKTQVLILENPTASAISPTIDGDGGTTVGVPGIGSVDVSGGYAVGSIAAGAAVSLICSTVSAYLQGTITITTGSGLVATLLEL